MYHILWEKEKEKAMTDEILTKDYYSRILWLINDQNLWDEDGMFSFPDGATFVKEELENLKDG